MGKGSHGGQKGFILEKPDFLGFRGESLGLLDNFIEVLFGFGCGFRKLRYFVPLRGGDSV